MASQFAHSGGDRNQESSAFPCLLPSSKGSSAQFDASVWITRCSGRPQISKINYSSSGTTSTTIARIPHGKGKRPIRPPHDQSQICARFDGNLTVEAYIRRPWQPDFSKTRARCGIRSTSPKPRNELIWRSEFVIAACFAVVSPPPYQFARDRLLDLAEVVVVVVIYRPNME